LVSKLEERSAIRVYPYGASFISNEGFTLAVEPGKQFSVAMFRQDVGSALASAPRLELVASSGVTLIRKGSTGRFVFASEPDLSTKSFDQDWNWPTLTLRLLPSQALPASDAYAAVVFEVDSTGDPTDPIGVKVANSMQIFPYPPDSDSMALLLRRPETPSAPIAYIIPTATYHAYNWTGGGCFYGYQGTTPPSTAYNLVTLHRPGGGLGAVLGEPPDYYDTQSPRQQFAHWDARFIMWMKSASPAFKFDVYGDLDLHAGLVPLSSYKMMLSVGHHEYWSQAMRDQLSGFLARGGNYACFGANTCFRPIDFGSYRSAEWMKVVRHLWPYQGTQQVNHWPYYNESQLIGLSYGYGGGKWGSWSNGQWTGTARPAYGYQVLNANHWVFANTGLSQGQTFGDTDHLVGYEADGMPASGSPFTALARSPRLTGWDDVGGAASLGIMGTDKVPRRGMQFNAATTDWARVLTNASASSYPIVQKITQNVLNAFTT
jgi:hypothetical protein